MTATVNFEKKVKDLHPDAEAIQGSAGWGIKYSGGWLTVCFHGLVDSAWRRAWHVASSEANMKAGEK